MNTRYPEFSLADLADAVEATDGTHLNPQSEEGRKQLLKIAQGLLENPVAGHALLRSLKLSNSERCAPAKPWAHYGQVRIVDMPEIPDEEDYLLDGLDPGPIIAARRLVRNAQKKVGVGMADADTRREAEKSLHEGFSKGGRAAERLASPVELGFDDEPSKRPFNREAFGSALLIAKKQLRSALVAKEESNGFVVRAQYNPRRTNVMVDKWKVVKIINASNFQEVKIDHARNQISIAYIGSGNDLYLKFVKNEDVETRTKEWLGNSKHVASSLINVLSDDPEVGLEVVESLLVDFSQDLSIDMEI